MNSRLAVDAWLGKLPLLLTRDDFHAQSADVTYAAAAVFVGFLRKRFGAEGLRAVYMACSGTAAEVASWSRDDVQRRLAGALAVALHAAGGRRLAAYRDAT
jgi:hypothetical protein